MGAAGLSRNAVVRLFAWAHDVLPTVVSNFRHNRAPGRPHCFIARKVIVDSGAVQCVFIVNDQNPDLLVVVDFSAER
jgi:hypothetical protein